MHLPGNQSHAPLLKGAGWSGNLPAFFEITAENLKHDMEDAKKVQAGPCHSECLCIRFA